MQRQAERRARDYLVRHLDQLRSPMLSLGCGDGVDELRMARCGLDVLATGTDPAKLAEPQLAAAGDDRGRAYLLRPSPTAPRGRWLTQTASPASGCGTAPRAARSRNSRIKLLEGDVPAGTAPASLSD